MLATFFLLMRLVAFAPFLVEGPSMLPTIRDGEIFVLDRQVYSREEPQRGDIVVFSTAKEPDYFYVKRIVGLPGERLHVTSNGIYLESGDGSKNELPEPYLAHAEDAGSVDAGKNYSLKGYRDEIFAVPADKYFLLGDNRAHSLDSRSFIQPFVPKNQIRGKYLFTLFSKGPVVILSTEKGKTEIAVEIADESAERTQGLMYRENLPDGKGMFFIFEKEEPLAFWMKNTLIPLDMIFLDANYRVVSVARNVQPCKADPCTLYPSGKPAKYVLEVNAGTSDNANLQEGDSAELVI